MILPAWCLQKSVLDATCAVPEREVLTRSGAAGGRRGRKPCTAPFGLSALMAAGAGRRSSARQAMIFSLHACIAGTRRSCPAVAGFGQLGISSGIICGWPSSHMCSSAHGYILDGAVQGPQCLRASSSRSFTMLCYRKTSDKMRQGSRDVRQVGN